MAELADAADLKSASFGSTGSIPVPDTSFYFRENPRKKQLLTLANKFACQEFCFLLLFFLQGKKMGILSALRVAVADAPALRRTDVRLVDPRFANKFACQEFCFLLLFFCNAKKWGFSLRCGLPSLTLRLCGGLTSAWSIPVPDTSFLYAHSHCKKNGETHFAGGLPPHPVHYNAVCENGPGK